MQMLVTVHDTVGSVLETRVNRLLQQGYTVSSTSCDKGEYRAVLVMDIDASKEDDRTKKDLRRIINDAHTLTMEGLVVISMPLGRYEELFSILNG